MTLNEIWLRLLETYGRQSAAPQVEPEREFALTSLGV